MQSAIDETVEADLDAAWADVGPLVVRRLMIAATQEFAARGYHATTTRDIARRAGLSPAGVYVHFRSKEELLYRISLIGHEQSLANVRALAAAHDDPVARLRAVVAGFTAWHATNHVAARVILHELAALSPDHYTEIVTLRRAIDQVVRETLEYGVEQGAFDVLDIAGTALALLSLGLDVPRWYRSSGGRWTPETLGALHADLAERIIHKTPPME